MKLLNFLFLFGFFIASDVRCGAKIIPKTFVDIQAAEIHANHKNFTTKTFTKTNATTCKLFLQKDLPKPNEPQPLYINPTTNELWEPNAKGFLEIPSGQTIELYCSTNFANETDADSEHIIPKLTKTLKPTCIYNRTFMWQVQKYELNKLVCQKPMKYVAERMNEQCAGGTAELYRIGFNITENRFIETMRICYDTGMMRNHYTQHRMLPASAHFQSHVPRLKFSTANFFDKHNVNFYYTQRNQWQRAYEIFGSNKTVANIFNDKDLFLARGHLAAKADYIYANQQRSTFTYLNVAPQWQTFNSGQWSSLEDNVRKFLSRQQLDVISYTGTWGTLSLRPPNNFQMEAHLFHLAKDENNNDILPVPKLFFRVIVERRNPFRGIALIGVNNPLATFREIEDSYIICQDIKEKVPWLGWIRGNDSLKKGYIYACNVQDFIKVVNILPKYLKNVNETLT